METTSDKNQIAIDIGWLILAFTGCPWMSLDVCLNNMYCRVKLASDTTRAVSCVLCDAFVCCVMHLSVV